MSNVTPLSLQPLPWAFRFWGRHFGRITLLMLVAALGRALQMKAAGPVSTGWYIVLEVVVLLARILTLLTIIGLGTIPQGIARVTRVFRLQRAAWRQLGRLMWRTLRNQWPVFLSNFLLFCVVAFAMNWLIARIADSAEVIQFLKSNHLLAPSATGLPVVFFLKNCTVIAFTLVFDFSLFWWLAGKSQRVVAEEWTPDGRLADTE